MSLVAALICDLDTRTHLRLSLAGSSQLEFCCRGAELLEIVLRMPARIILTDLRDGSGTSVAPTVRRLHRQFSTIPILAYCSLTPGISDELLGLMHAGISGILFRGLDDVGKGLRSALECTDDRCVAEMVTAALAPHIPPEGRMVIEYCVEHARAAPTVAQVATAIGVHRKTLVNWMMQARLPPPRAITGWCRILLAARLLEDRGRSVERVALDLGFGSGTELRNMLRRYTGLRPAEVRGRGGFQQVLDLFMNGREQPASSLPAAPVSGSYDPVHVPRPELPVAHRRTV